MRGPEEFLIFTEPLESGRFVHMVTGSVASIVYGEPRLTHDVDVVLDLDRARARELVKLFPLEDFYCPPEEVLRIEAGRALRGHFNLIHHRSGYKADVYLRGRDSFHDWGLARRRRIDLGEGRGLWLAPPEYVIVRKLQFYRDGGSAKHLSDVRGMLETSADLIDLSAVEEWSRALSVSAQWAEVRRP